MSLQLRHRAHVCKAELAQVNAWQRHKFLWIRAAEESLLSSQRQHLSKAPEIPGLDAIATELDCLYVAYTRENVLARLQAHRASHARH